jgi:hypothetical protein
MKTKDLISTALKKAERAAQEQYFQNLLSFNDEEYNKFFFDYGMLFLDNYFKDHNTITTVATATSYWKWWRQEWMLWEMDLVKFIEIHTPVFKVNDWHSDMINLCGSKRTELSFKLYLKLFHNVRIS